MSFVVPQSEIDVVLSRVVKHTDKQTNKQKATLFSKREKTDPSGRSKSRDNFFFQVQSKFLSEKSVVGQTHLGIEEPGVSRFLGQIS